MTNALEQERSDWFCEQVQQHLSELLGAALRFTRNNADAEDLVADAVPRAWKHVDTLDDRAAFRAWIFRIMTNRYISLKRAQNARPVHETYDEESADDASFSLFEQLHQPFLLWWSNPEQAFLRRLLRHDFDRAIDALPDEFRIAVMLRDVQGLSYREVADALEVPVGTVKSRLARGRSLLQSALWEHARDAGLRADAGTGAGTPITPEQK